MDEFRIMRRIALVAALNCVAVHSYADDSVSAESSTAQVSRSSDSPFKSLLAGGWESNYSSRESRIAGGTAAPSVVAAESAPSAVVQIPQATPLPQATPSGLSADRHGVVAEAPELTPWESDPSVAERSLADLIREQELGRVDAPSAVKHGRPDAPPALSRDAISFDTAQRASEVVDVVEAGKPVAEMRVSIAGTSGATGETAVEALPRQAKVESRGLAEYIRWEAALYDTPNPEREPSETGPNHVPAAVIVESKFVDSVFADDAAVEPTAPMAPVVAGTELNTTTALVAKPPEPSSAASLSQRSRRVANQGGFGFLTLERLPRDPLAIDPLSDDAAGGCRD